MDPLYPDVTVELSGRDGNAFVIIGAVSAALRRAGRNAAVVKFKAEATEGDYVHLLQTAMRYVNVV